MASPTTPTLASLNRISPTSLSKKILAGQRHQEAGQEAQYAIIDVRDDDYIGGHIKGSIHAPSAQLDAMMPALLRTLDAKTDVVFHCMLSQQRGPSAALRYLRERIKRRKSGGGDDDDDDKVGDADNQDKDGQPQQQRRQQQQQQQHVWVLDGGFTAWQRVYGSDERLTEGYRSELWQDE